ncbi:MAG: DNA-binding protein [Fretibacterium sp.]|nr:DNA-binding protein [Fretibacterium sp.]
MERRICLNVLYDLYSPLLTEHQRKVYEMLYFSDLTPTEIANLLNISRQAVHILLRRITKRLEAIEEDLGFAVTLKNLTDKIEALEAELKQADENISPEGSIY